MKKFILLLGVAGAPAGKTFIQMSDPRSAGNKLASPFVPHYVG